MIERIRRTQKLNNQANGLKDAIEQAASLQTKTGNGQNGNFSKRCPLCDDTTWIEYIKDKRNCAYRCECYNKMQNDRNHGWKDAGLTLESSKLNFTTFKPWNEKVETMKNTAVNYFKDFDSIRDTRSNSIIFCGNPGCGKTHLSIAIANNLIRKKKKVIYMPYRDIIMGIKQNILDSEMYNNTLNKYRKIEVLLIDDLFKGQRTQSDLNIIFEIINYRYMNNLPMIISTELTIADIIQIDEAVGSRIYEMIRSYTVEIIGIENNYRLK
ncbi:ATP-binding protein [Clostridium gasigenes]|nr:ATP-binding protein [Clostridium gasigenes]MBU3134080.1 ATP-binding protein [Clostridium gasigenes]